MDGLEAVEIMRKDDDLKKTPIIFLTARSDEKTEIDGLNKGGDDYITKPISTTKLVSRIKAALRRFDDSEQTANKLEAHTIWKLIKIAISYYKRGMNFGSLVKNLNYYFS